MAELSLTTALDLVGDTRELTDEDISEFQRLGPAEPMTLDAVKLRHHRIAQLLAQGLKVTEVAFIVGVHPQAIHVLKRNATFQELVKELQKELFEDDTLIAGQMREITIQGLSALQQQIIDGDIAGDDLRKVVEGTLDRIGHGPTRKVEKRTVALSAIQIEMIREEVRSGEAAGGRPALGADSERPAAVRDASRPVLTAEAGPEVRASAAAQSHTEPADGDGSEGLD